MIRQMTVRYIKNGEGGRWWRAAKEQGQLHAGWSPSVSQENLQSRHLPSIEEELRNYWVAQGKPKNFGANFNQLKTLLDNPSQYIWITFAVGYMWWCTTKDDLTVNPEGESQAKGHFWLLASTFHHCFWRFYQPKC